MEARAVPPRSDAQRRAALEKAQTVRIWRARLKDRIKDGGRSRGVPEVAWQLADPHPLIETMHVYDLLIACPTIGKVKANRILIVCRVSPSKTIGGLSDRQRLELVCQLVALTPGDEKLIRKLQAVEA